MKIYYKRHTCLKLCFFFVQPEYFMAVWFDNGARTNLFLIHTSGNRRMRPNAYPRPKIFQLPIPCHCTGWLGGMLSWAGMTRIISNKPCSITIQRQWYCLVSSGSQTIGCSTTSLGPAGPAFDIYLVTNDEFSKNYERSNEVEDCHYDGEPLESPEEAEDLKTGTLGIRLWKVIDLIWGYTFSQYPSIFWHVRYMWLCDSSFCDCFLCRLFVDLCLRSPPGLCNAQFDPAGLLTGMTLVLTCSNNVTDHRYRFRC